MVEILFEKRLLAENIHFEVFDFLLNYDDLYIID